MVLDCRDLIGIGFHFEVDRLANFKFGIVCPPEETRIINISLARVGNDVYRFSLRHPLTRNLAPRSNLRKPNRTVAPFIYVTEGISDLRLSGQAAK